MAQDWDIKPRGLACAKCKTDFADKQQYNSALAFNDDGYLRADFCDSCWSAGGINILPYSSWQGVFKAPPPQKEEPLKKESAENYLRKLMEQDDASQINVIYILAVMLERKRILAERDVKKREDGMTIRVYEHRKSGETFLIPDPHLQLDKLEEVQQQVMDLLGWQKKDKQGQEEKKEEPPAEQD
jgi:hypothetical protein